MPSSPGFSRYLHIALLFVSHFVLGTFIAVLITYQYEQSRWFASLTEAQNRQLLSLREALLSSHAPATGTPPALLRDLSRLESVRTKAAPEAQPVLDLRIAGDHALLARAYANDPVAAAAQTDSARSILHQLGWSNISDATLTELASQRLQSIHNKEVR